MKENILLYLEGMSARWRTVAIAAGAVVVLAILATGAWFWSSIREHRGADAYAEALLHASQAQTPQVTPEARTTAILELERVLEAYPSNGMAAEAAYALGDLRFSGGEHDKARAAWQLAISRSRATTLTTLARAGIGAAWEADKNLPEATQAYETALADLKPTSFYYEELLVDLARVQELSGKKDAATATYRRLLKDLPRSVRADEIRNRLAHLGVTP